MPARRAVLVEMAAHRHRQAEVIQQRGPQVLDHAPLEHHGLVEHLHHRVEFFVALRLERRADARRQPRHVHLGGGDQATELIVQFLGERRALDLRS